MQIRQVLSFIALYLINMNDPGYQILSDEEIVAEVVGNQKSKSNDEENEMPVMMPKLSKASSCMDTVPHFVKYKNNTENSAHHGNI